MSIAIVTDAQLLQGKCRHRLARTLLFILPMQYAVATYGHEPNADSVRDESVTTIETPSPVTTRNPTGNRTFRRLTDPVAALRQIGAVRRAVIVVNDLAPGAKNARWKNLMAYTLGDRVELTEVHVSHFEGAYAAARGAAAWGAELVIAVGGDGTVNACVNGVDDTHTRIAVMPAGTANDLAHLVGQQGEVGADAAGMESWERVDIDAITSNGIRYYSTGGMGWVADVAATANRWRIGGSIRRKLLSLLGSLIYPLACLAVILFSRRLGARYNVRYTDARTGHEHEVDLDGYGLLAANCKRVGSSFTLAPVSEMDDGAFELIMFPRTSRLRLLRAVLAAQRGKLFELPEMEWIQVSSARVVSDTEVQFFGDGEILGSGTKFDIDLAPTPVRLMAPGAADTMPAVSNAMARFA
jgi:diacylglycerol kinase family enzyme